MNQEIKEKWIAALRSGKYEQGTGQLQSGDKYCCLGVLCAVVGAEYDPDAGSLPPDVVQSVGLQDRDPTIEFAGTSTYISVVNDGDSWEGIEAQDFNTIADIIAEQL